MVFMYGIVPLQVLIVLEMQLLWFWFMRDETDWLQMDATGCGCGERPLWGTFWTQHILCTIKTCCKGIVLAIEPSCPVTAKFA